MHSSRVRLPHVPSLSWDDCRLLVESVADYAIFMLDVDGRVATWNLGAERIKGYRAEEIVGEHFSRFYPEEDVRAGKPEVMLRTATEQGRVEDEGWRIRKDGSRFWGSVVTTALRDVTGELRGFGKVTRDLTSRKASEEQLRQAELRFHHLVDAVIDYAIFLLDPDGRVTTWNLGAQRLKGYTADEVLGKHFSVFFPADAIASGKPRRELEVARAEGRVEDEGWRVRKDGTRFWANAIVTALRSADGQLVGFAKVTRDLTARREAELVERQLLREQTARETAQKGEEQLRESEERYRKLSHRLDIILQGVADGITVQDRAGLLVFANGAAARIFGASSPEEVEQRPLVDVLSRFELLDVASRPLDIAALPGRRAVAGESAGSAVLQLSDRATEHRRWLNLRVNPVLEEEGTPELAVNIWHDITVERQHETEARYLAEASTVLGASTDDDETLAALSALLIPGLAEHGSIYRFDGVDLRRVCAHAAGDGSEADREMDPSWDDLARDVVESGTSALLGVRHAQSDHAEDDSPAEAVLRASGMRAALLVPIRSRERGVVGAIALGARRSSRRFDPSTVRLVEELARRTGVALEKAHLYRAARVAAQEAEEASRAKDEFLATLSHELRTPLNAIMGWAAMLRSRVEDPALARPIEVIHRNAQAQVKIVEDILDVSRIITGKFRIEEKAIDLVAIVEDAIEVIRPSAAAKRIAVEFSPQMPTCMLVADPVRLQQVIWNLLSNAVKFTEAGGRITVSVDQESSKVVVVVRDTGQGIAPAFLPQVFERFKQADSTITRRFGGLGLGLALVRHIVELHGGKVAAASEGPGRGATFTVTLPIRAVAVPADEAVDATVTQRKSPTPPSSRLLAGVRVLVVDDEVDARDLVTEVLEGAGAEVRSAPSAAEGLETFLQFRPDVLVSDVGMPEEDGLSFLRKIRALPAQVGGGTPAVALTAFAREHDRTRALSAGFTTHIGKPVDPEALVSAVANLSLLTARH